MEGFALDQRVARAIGNQVLWQDHGQILLWHGLGTAVFAVDDGDGRAPVTLAADAPVTQAPGGFQLAQALGFQYLGHGLHAVLVVQAVKLAGVDENAALLVAVPVAPLLVVISSLAFHGHHLLDGQTVLVGKGKVALVVGGHAHHGAVAIAHQHIVADPDLDLGAGDGWVTNRPVGLPSFSLTASSASVVPPFLHSSMKAASSGLRPLRAVPADARVPRRRRSRP